MLKLTRVARWLAPLALIAGISGAVAQAATAPRARGRDVRRRLLLVRGGGLREGAGRDPRRFRLHRRHGGQARPTSRLPPRPPATRGRAGHLRPDQGQLPAARRLVLAQHRPRRCQGAVLRQGQPLPLRRSSTHDEEQKKVAEATKQELQASGRFKEPIATAVVAAGAVLPGRGLPPGLLQEEPAPLPVLQDRLRPRLSAWSRSGARPSRRRR